MGDNKWPWPNPPKPELPKGKVPTPNKWRTPTPVPVPSKWKTPSNIDIQDKPNNTMKTGIDLQALWDKLGIKGGTAKSSNESGLGYSMAGKGNTPYSGLTVNPLGTTSSSGGSGGGGSALGALAPEPVQATTQDVPLDLQALYQGLIDKATSQGTSIKGDFDSALAKIIENYNKSQSNIYSQYMGTREGLDQQAASLGIDANSMFNKYDTRLKGIDENYDQAQNNDQAFFEKLKALSGTSVADIVNSLGLERDQRKQAQQSELYQLALAREQAAAEAATSSGGGSGGGGGGGGSSNKTNLTQTETATQTDTLNDPYAYQTYLQLLQTNPEAAAAYKLNMDLTSENAATKLTAEQIQQASANKTRATIQANKPGWNLLKWPSQLAAKASDAKIKTLLEVLKATYNSGGSISAVPKSSQKVTTTGKTTTKK
jgi:hypothetical protein